MSLYNMVMGYNPSVFFVLPMLGKHPDDFPRFRDCFIKDEDRPDLGTKIFVHTRTGGNNRESYESEIEEMENLETYVTNYDDSFDSTYGTWVYNVPEKWKLDFEKIIAAQFQDVSSEYMEVMINIYPDLEDKIRKSFRG